jgi:hypothetical protein
VVALARKGNVIGFRWTTQMYEKRKDRTVKQLRHKQKFRQKRRPKRCKNGKRKNRMSAKAKTEKI